jgi:hypothetical protein
MSLGSKPIVVTVSKYGPARLEGKAKDILRYID